MSIAIMYNNKLYMKFKVNNLYKAKILYTLKINCS
jgi:hypothetical protein